MVYNAGHLACFYKNYIKFGIIHLVRTQTFPKNLHFLLPPPLLPPPPNTNMYTCVHVLLRFRHYVH